MRLRGIATFCVAVCLAAASASAQVLPVPQTPDPLLAGLDIPADADVKGMWSPLKSWPLVGLHAALMPNGSVLTYGTPLGQGVQDGRTFDIWDPAKGFTDAAHYTTLNAEAIDSFCSTAAFLMNGSMLISGGASFAGNWSSNSSMAFWPQTNAPRPLTWGDPLTLSFPRWYGTMITLPDGRALMTGGGKPYVVGAFNDPAAALANKDVSITPEVYEQNVGWKQLAGATSIDAFGANDNRWFYPRMWIGLRGEVFGISSNTLWSMNTAGNGALQVVGNLKTGFTYSPTDKPNTGPTSTAVMYDVGRILQVGGNGPTNGAPTFSSAAATVIDIRGNAPALIEQPPMLFPRQWANATVIPNGQVVVTGGAKFADDAGDNAVYDAEIWSPATGTWRAAAKAAVYRGYHSAVILLPNGTLLSTGGGVPGPVTNLNAEIYYPPYLFRKVNGRTELAPRPQVRTFSGYYFTYEYGEEATITLTNPETIDRVVIIGTSSTTHSFNTSQRFVPATFRQAGDQVTVTMPASVNLAPPGYYLVFLLNAAGVPSNGVMVSLGGMAVVQKAPLQLTIDEAIGLQSLTYTDQRVRHAGFMGYLSRVTATSGKIEKDDSAFIVRRGLWRGQCYAFESRNYPGYFLRYQGGRLKLQAWQEDGLFKREGTFCTRAPMNEDPDPNSITLEPLGMPGYALRNRGGELWVDGYDGTRGFEKNASFRRVPAY